jgi:hypothetical protein
LFFLLLFDGGNINRAVDDCCLVSIFTSAAVEFFTGCWSQLQQQEPPTSKNSPVSFTKKEEGERQTAVDAYHPAALRRLPNGAATTAGAARAGSWRVYLPPAVRPFPTI